jgi:Immunity protein 53
MYGITIITSDNPAWNVTIDVVETRFRVDEFESYENGISPENPDDWVRCELSEDRSKFGGVGDPTKLDFILDYFFRYAGNER